ncbi:tetratricopeptide repeat protein [Hymenobacter negativus]|uniref:Tetratricopeptide repeat protein n=1 Tax=Hymenobacter negativus TaxID=2795026 RepID=A0ABS3QKJ6_9BACT|nr:tetratricopeptide repeat protein [Hymenobacter negativus]MBO2011601.1 tetratricopeptide repeat protein [Hymenobacter negativus]
MLLPGTVRAQPDLISSIEQLAPAVRPTGQPDSLLLDLKRQYNHAVENHDDGTAATSLQAMGRICYHLGQYPQAFDFHRKAGQLFAQLNQQAQLADNFNDLGALYFANKQPAQARQQYKLALALNQRAGNEHGLAMTYGKIGHLCEKLERNDSAFHYQHLALWHYRRSASQAGVGKIYENLGSIFENWARYDSAQFYFAQALRLSQRSGDEIAQIEILNNLGDVLRKTGRYAAGLHQTREALVLAQKTGEHHQLSGAYSDLAKTFSLLGRNDSAYYYSALSRKYQVATYSATNQQQLALLQTLYDLERKDQQIAQLGQARYLNRVLLAAGAGLGLLLLGLAWATISRQQLKIRSSVVLSEQNRRIYEAQHELLQLELKNKQLEEDNLKQELAARSRELSAHTLHVIQKNQLLEELRRQLGQLVKEEKRDQKKQLKQLLHQIGQNVHHDQHWEDFRSTFEQVHQPFFDKLHQHCDTLTAGERRLVALLKINLTSQDIATSLGVSLDSLRVMRYRLRKRLNLPAGESLTAFLQTL